MAEFEKINDYEDCADRIVTCKETVYNEGISLKESGDYVGAVEKLNLFSDYEDSTDQITFCKNTVYDRIKNTMTE